MSALFSIASTRLVTASAEPLRAVDAQRDGSHDFGSASSKIRSSGILTPSSEIRLSIWLNLNRFSLADSFSETMHHEFRDRQLLQFTIGGTGTFVDRPPHVGNLDSIGVMRKQSDHHIDEKRILRAARLPASSSAKPCQHKYLLVMGHVESEFLLTLQARTQLSQKYSGSSHANSSSSCHPV